MESQNTVSAANTQSPFVIDIKQAEGTDNLHISLGFTDEEGVKIWDEVEKEFKGDKKESNLLEVLQTLGARAKNANEYTLMMLNLGRMLEQHTQQERMHRAMAAAFFGKD